MQRASGATSTCPRTRRCSGARTWSSTATSATSSRACSPTGTTSTSGGGHDLNPDPRGVRGDRRVDGRLAWCWRRGRRRRLHRGGAARIGRGNLAEKGEIMKAVPIKGLPPASKRPRCPNCGKLLLPWVDTKVERRERKKTEAELQADRELDYHAVSNTIIEVVNVEKTFLGSYKGYDAFDTLRCAAEFANAAYRAGYRR